ncbi:uncharacterized protein [Epargyreus clarus]|uniref:uncharacterized protein n=1 Tax=Epargyreus clarus TaxID=520877 RepID=UPI003C3058AE
MSSGSYLVNVPKLKGRENYDDWAFAARNFLILEGIDIDAIPVDLSESEDRKAKAKLIMTIDPKLYVHIKNETKVKNLWQKLQKLFDDSGFTRKINLLRSLISIRLDNCESMTSYVSQIVETAQRLKGTGFEINEEWIGSLLLAGLPEKFAPMIMAIEHSGIAINSDVIKTKLLDMSSEVGDHESEVALLSKHKSKKEKQVNAFSAAFFNSEFDKEDWYIDSGASAHMTPCKENLLQNELIGIANLQNGVYKLNTMKSEKVLAAAVQTSDAKQWHRRLGHINSNDLQKMKNGAVDGILFDMKADIQKSNCKKTNPYTPEQNGLCERFNRTIVERARCLLFEAKLDKSFWAEAVNTAVYLKNRTPASGLDQKTPIEVWTGRKPDLSHVRIFGSPVMMHVPKNKRLKWDKKAVQFILVGYSENVKGYRLYNPETKKICTSRDVIIMEPDIVQIEINEGQIEKQQSIHGESSMRESDTTLINQDDPTYVYDSEKSISSTEGESYQTLSEEEDYSENEEPQLVGERTRRPPERYGFTNLCISDEPESWAEDITYEEATNGPEKDKWKQAMSDELQAFHDNHAWEIVGQEEADRVVQCKWVFKKKAESNNKVRSRTNILKNSPISRVCAEYNRLSTKNVNIDIFHDTILNFKKKLISLLCPE